MKLCPNGRYLLTGGNKGDVAIWKIDKRVADAEVMRDLVKLQN